MVVGKIIQTTIKNKENKFTDSNGNERTSTKSEIQRIEKVDSTKTAMAKAGEGRRYSLLGKNKRKKT